MDAQLLNVFKSSIYLKHVMAFRGLKFGDPKRSIFGFRLSKWTDLGTGRIWVPPLYQLGNGTNLEKGC